MNNSSRRRFVRAWALAASLAAGTLWFANSSRAETVSDMGVTHYLHHKLGIHDYLWGPGGVIPRTTGLPEQVPTRHEVSLLRGTYPVGPYRRPAPSRTTRINDLNLFVTMPAGPWQKIDPQQTGSRASFLARRTDPAIMISLGGVPAGIGINSDNSSLLAESQAKLLSLPDGQIEPTERELSAGGIRGIAYEATATSGKATIYYTMWVAAHHGYHYKLAVYGDYQHKPAIDEAMQNFLRGLKPIQPNRVAVAGARKTPTRR